MSETSSATNPVHPKWRHPLVVCVILGAIVRFAWLWASKDQPWFYAHVQDSALYHDMANRILAEGLPFDGPFTVAPLYAVFLAAIYSLLGPDPLIVYGLQIALSLVGIGLASHLGRSLFGAWGQWSGGLVAALYPAAILFDVRLLSVTLGTVLTLLAAVMAQRAWSSCRSSHWLLAGLSLGVGALVRANLVVVGPLLALAVLIRPGHRRARLLGSGAVVLGLALGISPATIHNASTGAGFVPISLGGGINLYRGNNPLVVSAAVHPFRLPPTRDGLTRKAQLIASIESQRPLSKVEAERYWIRRALSHWMDDPVRYVGLTLRKAVSVVSPLEIGDHMDLDHEIQRTAILRYIPPIVLPVTLLGVVGLCVTRRRDDGALFAIAIGGVFSVAVFFVVSRYRAPLIPLLAVYAGGGLHWLVNAIKERAHRRMFIAGVGMASLGAALSVPVTDSRLPWSWMAEHGDQDTQDNCAVDQHVRRAPDVEERFQVGVFAMDHGQWKDAEEAMWSVVREDAGHTAAGVNLSWMLLQRGATAEAAGVARVVLEQDECDDKAWSNLATALLRQGEYGAALEASQKAMDIDPYNPAYWSILGEARLALGRVDSATAMFERAIRWDDQLWQPRARLGRIALQERRYEEASGYLQAAVRLRPDRAELVGLLGLSEIGRGNSEGAQGLLDAAVRSGMKGPAISALSRALSQPGTRAPSGRE